MPDLEPFEPFDLNILHAAGQGATWLSASSRLGAIHAVPPREPSVLPLQALHDDAAWFRSAVQQGAPAGDQASAFGTQLSDLVFSVNEIASLFGRTRGAAAAAGRPLLVRLLAVPEVVAALPWELLTDPDDTRSPLVFAPDAHLVRMARDRRYPLRVEPIPSPLNVLLVLSNPQGSGPDDAPFDHYEEGRALLAELQDLIDRGILLVDVEDRPSIENLRRRLGARERGYHVVHYLGHARPGALKLEDNNGMPAWVPSDQFNALLRTCPDLRLTFFAGCRTASIPPGTSSGEFTSSLSVADRCVREACQTVLGMQEVLPFRTEQILTRFFYQALCAGATMARALSLARAAVRDDETLGRDLVNWAVPSLVTGYLPGTIIDPAATPATSPRTRPRRRQLKLELTEPDREFFARFAQLREALTVLCRLGPKRVLWVTGAPGAGKSRLLARALDELDEGVVAVLYVSAARLAQGSDPVEELCRLVTELLERAERRPPPRDDTWDSIEWWDRLIEELVETPFVLAIDDVDGLNMEVASALGAAVDRLVSRVSKARVALAGGDIRTGFLSEVTMPLVSKVHVLNLDPAEVLQWVRRNRPALAAVLASRTNAELGRVHNKLGFKLHLWARLDEELARQRVKDLSSAVEAVMATEPAAGPVVPAPRPPVTTDQRPVGMGPLRVAIAGPFTVGREQQFADSIAALALAHGAGVRVVIEGAPDAATAVAQLLSLESPFSSQGTASAEAIVDWLSGLEEIRPELVLLDYGHDEPVVGEEERLRALAAGGTLLIAAGGNDVKQSWPASHDFVLSIGALDGAGRPARFSVFDPKTTKPDLYAPGTLAETLLEGMLNVPGGGRGTSFAALNALVAAVLVWAVDRTMPSDDVAHLLRSTASRVYRRRLLPKRLNLEAAVDAARVRLVASGLVAGPLDEHTLGAASGLAENVARPLLDQLVAEGKVKLESGRYRADTNLASMIS